MSLPKSKLTQRTLKRNKALTNTTHPRWKGTLNITFTNTTHPRWKIKLNIMT